MFPASGNNAGGQPNYSGMNVQTSSQGLPIPILYGMGILSWNLIWTGNFQQIPSNGKKGSGSGKKGSSSSNVQSYASNNLLSLCEGPIAGIGNVWQNKTVFTGNATPLTAAGTYPGAAGLGSGANQFSATLNDGALDQAPDITVSEIDAAQALNYKGLAYISAYINMGAADSLPSIYFEVKGLLYNATTLANGFVTAGANANGDINPADFIIDVLTNPKHGVGFPLQWLGSLQKFRDYCTAYGLMISPVLDSQDSARDWIKQITDGVNAAFCLSGGVLDVIPFGDVTTTANGATYTAPGVVEIGGVPVELTKDDFIPKKNAPPIDIVRKRQSDIPTRTKVEFSQRSNMYNPAPVWSPDDLAGLALFGFRESDPVTEHFICDPNVAMISACLLQQRNYIRNTYKFTLGWQYILLDCMDIVMLTNPNQNLNKQRVRITSIDEDENGNLEIEAEEYIQGLGNAFAYVTQSQIAGFGSQTSQGVNSLPPPTIEEPLIFQTPSSLWSDPYEIWMSVAPTPVDAGVTAPWAGCNVLLSLDGGSSYPINLGTISQPGTLGALTADFFGTWSPVMSRPSRDETNTLEIQLDVTTLPELPGATANIGTGITPDSPFQYSYVDGELIAYGDTTGNNQGSLETAPGAYEIGYQPTDLPNGVILREQLGTSASDHALGSTFAQLDGTIFVFGYGPFAGSPYGSSLAGQTLYFKFQSFGVTGITQDISTCTAYSFVVPAGG